MVSPSLPPLLSIVAAMCVCVASWLAECKQILSFFLPRRLGTFWHQQLEEKQERGRGRKRKKIFFLGQVCDLWQRSRQVFLSFFLTVSRFLGGFPFYFYGNFSFASLSFPAFYAAVENFAPVPFSHKPKVRISETRRAGATTLTLARCLPTSPTSEPTGAAAPGSTSRSTSTATMEPKKKVGIRSTGAHGWPGLGKLNRQPSSN